MTEDEFARVFESLSRRIEAAPLERQHLFQSDLHRIVERALRAGLKLPEGVRTLDDKLTEAAIEAQFDNMPV